MGVRHDAPDSRTETVSGQAAEPVVALVLSHNKREATLRCVESVARLRYRPLEVVVVDNGSTDGTAGALAAAHPGVRLVRSGVNLGAAGGRNHGLAWIRAHLPYAYVLFLDDDATVDERLLDELVAALRVTPAAGMATPKAYRVAAPGILASAGGMRVRLARASIVDIGGGEPDQGQYETPRTVDSCVGFAVLARREVVERVGGFDEAFNPYGWEEVDFSLRVREAGYDIVYVPTAVAHHAGGVQGRGHRVAAYERRRIANFVRLMRRHATPADWLSAAAFLPGAGMRLVFRYARRREWKMLWSGLAGVVDDLRGRRDR